MQDVIKFVKGWLLFLLLWSIFMWFVAWQAQDKVIGMEPVWRLDLPGVDDHGGTLQNQAFTGLIIHIFPHSFALN